MKISYPPASQRLEELRLQRKEAEASAKGRVLKARQEGERVAADYKRRIPAGRPTNRDQQAYLRDAKQNYERARIAQTESLTTEVVAHAEEMSRILVDGLRAGPFALESLRAKPREVPWAPGPLERPLPTPKIEDFLPDDPGLLLRLVPGSSRRREEAIAAARQKHSAALAIYCEQEKTRQRHLAEYQGQHAARVHASREEAERQNDVVTKFKEDLEAGVPDAVSTYFELCLWSNDYPASLPARAFRIAYVAASKQLVLEFDIPSYECVPEITGFKYVKSADQIVEVPRPVKERKSAYRDLIAQTTLRLAHEVLAADDDGRVEAIVLNGYVDAVDPRTGRKVRPCLITLRTTRDVFGELELSRIDPLACLKALKASVSVSPDELSPVRPVLEFDMVDPRFIKEGDVLSTLDQRQNLMDLTPGEFESLITNLFSKMGLETRQTQASRDGGVDCVAFDPRPIFGGKVIIQAKRYKNTVGVSAVRDLFGTLQNEGGSKGILVTTSGYGKAAFEFVQGKPLELLDGGNLLFLLAQHAGIEAKIVMPEDWIDPQPDAR